MSRKEDRDIRNENLARSRGFSSYKEYRLDGIKNKGFNSYTEYNSYLKALREGENISQEDFLKEYNKKKADREYRRVLKTYPKHIQKSVELFSIPLEVSTKDTCIRGKYQLAKLMGLAYVSGYKTSGVILSSLFEKGILTEVEASYLKAYLRGYTYKEISGRYGCSTQNIGNRLKGISNKIKKVYCL